MKKVFLAMMAVATIAMIGCKKDEPATPTPTPGGGGGGEETELEIPEVAAPAAGKTTIVIYAEVCPKGAYLVGSFNSYNINDDAASFEAVKDAKNWYAVTIDYAADLQVKAIARPSDEDVPFAWSYQWGMNYNADAEDVSKQKVPEGTVNTLVVKGGTNADNLMFENESEVKLYNVADAGVIYVQVKNWQVSPVIEAKKLETAWVKSDFNGLDWDWYEMTAKGNGVFEFEGVWGGNGCNIAETKDGAAAWYPTDHESVTLVDDPAKGDKVRVTFTSEKMTVGKLEIKMIEKGTPAADIPGGNGTFVVKVTNRTYKDGDKCILTGNFDEKSWGDSDRAMTYDAGTGKWSWKGDYPKNFEMKVIYNDKWSVDPNIKFDGKTFEYEIAIQGEE